LTIILLILVIAGIAGAVWFYLQNSKNADALVNAEAKVQQLEDDLSASANSENTTAGQYDGLNDKIEDLSGQNAENLKTIEDYKKNNDELTKKVTDLTAQNTELSKKASEISTLTTRVDTMLNKLDDLLKNP
jgi:predicted RNase H-like nuclease (RuvC/YqgF family)